MIDNMLSKMNLIGDWAARLAYVNLLWILFSVIGLVVVGFFPATVAMFTVIRKWMMKEEVPVFQTFVKAYRENLLEANVIGLFLLVIGAFIYIDFFFLASMDGSIYTVIAIVLIPITFVYISIVLYIFPILVHYQLKKLEYIKYAFIISLSYPHVTLLMLLCLIILAATYITFPVLFPFLCASSLGFLSMFISKRVFEKIEKKGGQGDRVVVPH